MIRRIAIDAGRLIAVGACVVGIWHSLALARADHLVQKDTPESLRAAIEIMPDGWPYYLRLSQLQPEHADALLTESLRLNPYNAQADIELALSEEAEGNYGHAEALLLQAYAVDRTYLPRWSLTNFYLRRNNEEGFWKWARSAASIPSGDVGQLFALCWHVTQDASKITGAVLNDNPILVRQYIGFLLAHDQVEEVAAVALRLVRLGDREADRPLLLAAVNRLVIANDAGSSWALWRQLMDRQWVVADRTLPNNARFQREPVPVAFDWALPEYQGLHSWPGAGGLESEFSGSEPENCTVAEQTVVLAPGRYRFNYSYRTADIAEGTGIRWQIEDAKSSAKLAQTDDLASTTLKDGALEFTVPQERALVRLKLEYGRELGTPRITGTLVIPSTGIEAIPIRE